MISSLALGPIELQQSGLAKLRLALERELEELREKAGRFQDLENPAKDAVLTANIRGKVIFCSEVLKVLAPYETGGGSVDTTEEVG